MTSEFFVRPQEVWSAAECERRAKRTARDGMGTPYHFKGYIGSGQPNGGQWGQTRYNGGCVHEGKWYDGEIRNLPIVAEGFEIVEVRSWGYRIIKTKENHGHTGSDSAVRSEHTTGAAGGRELARDVALPPG